MEIKNMTIEEMEARKAEIAQLIETDDADLNALDEEVRSINAEIESRKAAESQRDEIRKAVAAGAGVTVKEIKEDNHMTIEELRGSAKYADAYANYIKTENDKECRTLLTENGLGSGNGGVPAPTLVDGIIRTAWESDQILSRVRRTFIRGNLKVAFERSADGAYVHTEGTTAVTEESLQLGIVTMIPANIKKWIRISDEAMSMGGEDFLRYIYDELTHQIVKKLADLVVADITGASTSHSATAVGIPQASVAPSLTAIPTAYANLSDEARNPVIVMNRLTYADFVSAQVAGNFSVDPFMGLPVLFNDSLPSYATASAGSGIYAFVGDLNGASVNYPEGDGVVIKWDDLSEAEADLIKVVGRQYAAHAVTAPGRFVNLVKPSAVTT